MTQQFKNQQDMGLDAGLALLDLQGFGAAVPQLQVDRAKIDFGAVSDRSRSSQLLTIQNSGRRLARADISVPPWLQADSATIQLLPGADTLLTHTSPPAPAPFVQLSVDRARELCPL